MYYSTFLLPEFVDVPIGCLKEIDPYLMNNSFQLLNQKLKIVIVPRWKKSDKGAEYNSSQYILYQHLYSSIYSQYQ